MARYAKKSGLAPETMELNSFISWFESCLHGDKMSSATVPVTPVIAEYILNRCNKGNRPLTQSRINEYAKAMKDGDFLLTSQGVSFSPSGELNNGQHRLHGIVRSGVVVKIYMTFGESRDVFHVLDTNKIRDAAAALSISGHKNTSVLGASARLLQNILDGFSSGNRKYLNKDVMDIVYSHPRLVEAITLSSPIHKKFRCPSASSAVACYLILTQSRNAIMLPGFVGRLMDGNDLAKSSPVLRLRDGLLNRDLGPSVSDSYTHSANVAASIIKTWNLCAKNQTRGGINLAPAEIFPSVV